MFSYRGGVNTVTQQQRASLEAGQPTRIRQLEELSAMNSGSSNLPGLAATLDALLSIAAPLGGETTLSDLPPLEILSDQAELIAAPVGQLATISKRPGAPRQLLLVGHYDTVFGTDHPFQLPVWTNPNVLNAPGSADMKGGILIMLAALEQLEQTETASDVGWTILFNPDEELGSVSSGDALASAARTHQFGMVFEPSFPDGNLAGRRKGSGTFRFVARGVGAHAGRDHHLGRNAITALSRIALDLDDLNGKWAETTINVGYVHGGGPTNIVPDLAILKLNVRVPDAPTAAAIETAINEIGNRYTADGITVETSGFFSRPPKELTPEIEGVLGYAKTTAQGLGFDLDWLPTGGVSDGNNLAAAGLPNIDNLGVHGGAIHSGDEYVNVESMNERAALATSLMVSFAEGRLDKVLGL